MIQVARFAAATAIVCAAAAPAMSQDALRRAPGTAPATEAGEPGDKAAKQGDREDRRKTDTESNGDAPRSDLGSCPYIKRKLELIV